jgi:glycosyltransferase involved in cell wall biosynthesis
MLSFSSELSLTLLIFWSEAIMHASLSEILSLYFKIAVIVPVYNRSDLVIEVLDQIYNQTINEKVVIIIVDDASTDNTPIIIKNWIKKQKSNLRKLILICCDKQGGASKARNWGIEAALSQGMEWIAFCDSDDHWHPQKLEKQKLKLQETGLKVCHTEEAWIKNGKHHNPKHIHTKPQGRIFLECLPRCCVSPSSVMIHKSVFEKVGLFDEDLWVCEDYELWLRIFAQYEIALCSEKGVTKYGGHADQLSTKYYGMDRFRMYGLVKAFSDLKPTLTDQEQNALVTMLLKKSAILEKGYRKHRGDYKLYQDIQQAIREGVLGDQCTKMIKDIKNTFEWKTLLNQ